MGKRTKPVDKEAIYITKLSPLMKQVFAICKENNIAMVASFHTGGGILFTTALTGKKCKPPGLLLDIASMLSASCVPAPLSEEGTP